MEGVREGEYFGFNEGYFWYEGRRLKGRGICWKVNIRRYKIRKIELALSEKGVTCSILKQRKRTISQ